jgi:hypothetical protein
MRVGRAAGRDLVDGRGDEGAAGGC